MRHGAKGGSPCPVVPPGERGVPLRRMSGSSGSGEDPPMTDLPPAVVTAMRLIRRLGVEFVRRYHRLEVLPHIEPFPDEPVLIVANHGFGGIVDLNVFALLATFDALRLDRPVTLLTHQLAWTLQVGRFLSRWVPVRRAATPAGKRSRPAATSSCCPAAKLMGPSRGGIATPSSSPAAWASPPWRWKPGCRSCRS